MEKIYSIFRAMEPQRRKASSDTVPTAVAERLGIWGAAIRKQRVAMGITAEDLCGRLDISRPTLRRMEKGDPATAAGLYLAALHVIGLLAQAAPRLEGRLWETTTAAPRAKGSRTPADDYF